MQPSFILLPGPNLYARALESWQRTDLSGVKSDPDTTELQRAAGAKECEQVLHQQCVPERNLRC